MDSFSIAATSSTISVGVIGCVLAVCVIAFLHFGTLR